MNKYLQPRKYVQFSKRVIAAVLRRTPVIRKHYRLRSRIDCVTDACNLINENYGEIGSRALNRTIERRLSWLGINFSQLPAHRKGDLYALFADEPLQPDRYDELKQQMLQAPVELLPCRQWLNLHEMCCFRGRYTLAQIFREKARQLAIKPLDGKEFEPPISWENTIGAAIEGGECHRSQDLDELLARAGITGDIASKWHLYLAVLNGQDIPRERVRRFDGSDFADYLAGNSIAIVGPAPTEALDAEEIDSHDLVVRLNHSYEGKGTDPKHKGLRSDITCFNGEQANAFINERGAVLPKEVTWGCFKPPANINLIQKINSNKKSREHISFQSDRMQFHGTLNMMPIVALDFSLFSAKFIKIYHTDLMLTVSRQKGYYPESFDYDKRLVELFLVGSINHDPVQQFRVLSQLYLKTRITGDSRFCDVMDMGLEKYLGKLEAVYAPRPKQGHAKH